MGVPRLWNILAEAKEEVGIRELKGKTLAVDLAIWVCNAKSPGTVLSETAFIRILFQRIRHFIKEGINLVFVLDGEASPLKSKTKSRGGRTATTASENRMRFVEEFSKVCELLDALGLTWLKAKGEAEGFCAELDKQGLVDGVITEDGDAFLYGAKTVYRKSKQGKKNDKAFTTLERYTHEGIETKLKLTQHHFIALGFLLGCDFHPGVKGIGVAKSMKLLSSWADRDPLEIFKRWKQGSNLIREHQQTVLEKNIRTKALKDPDFFDENVIDEFLSKKKYIDPDTQSYHIPSGNLKDRFSLKKPEIEKICGVLHRKLGWPQKICIKEVLPIITSFLLMQGPIDSVEVKMERILKTVKRKLIPSFEVQWELGGYASKLGPTYKSIERRDVIQEAFPIQVSEYLQQKEKDEAEKKLMQKEARKKKKTMPDHFKAAKQRKQFATAHCDAPTESQ